MVRSINYAKISSFLQPTWQGEFTQNTILDCAASGCLMRWSGPISQPTRHPVMPKDLPAEPTVRVRDQKFSSVAMRLCSLGEK